MTSHTEWGHRPPTRPRSKAAAYLALTKRRVIELLLVTTVPVMVLAAGGVPDPVRTVAARIGGALAAGAAGAFNWVLDRDIDRLMRRTQHRPLVTGELTTREALVFAAVLTVAAVGVLSAFTTVLAAVLGVAAIAFYVIVYTMWLKRRTDQNIIWGGIAGCFPVLIGWAAQTGTLSFGAFVLFGVVFLWTPAHYWPLSLRYRDDYIAAAVPMLAVTRSTRAVTARVVAAAWGTVICSLLLVPVAHAGVVYLVVAFGGGTWFLTAAHRLHRAASTGAEASPMAVFHRSITYLAILFGAVVADVLLTR